MEKVSSGALFSGPRVFKKYSDEFKQKFVARVLAGESVTAQKSRSSCTDSTSHAIDILQTFCEIRKTEDVV
jgi:hypothetical protein